MTRRVEVLYQIKKFMLGEGGFETVEWAIVGGVIVAGVLAFFVLIGGDVLRGVTSLEAEIAKISESTPSNGCMKRNYRAGAASNRC
jgi:hypothetical protein